jgi:hypothetical protein
VIIHPFDIIGFRAVPLLSDESLFIFLGLILISFGELSIVFT